MNAPQTTEEEPIPECAEVKLAYDLSAIPIIGLLFYVVLLFIIRKKLGKEASSKSFWLKKATTRVKYYSIWPCIVLIILGLTLSPLIFTVVIPERGGLPPDYDVQAMLQSVVRAQETYRTKYVRYASSIKALTRAGLLNKNELMQCNKPGVDSLLLYGYRYQMTAGRKWTATQFYVRCRPDVTNQNPPEWRRCFAVDQSGRVVTTDAYQ